jgi:uncharacterized protein
VLEIALTFVLAGIVKGVSGMGLPTVTMGVLGLFMAPANASALVIIPSLITNLWQFAAGENRASLLRRFWPMLLAMSAATVPAAGLLTAGHSERVTMALGSVLVVYGVIGLARLHVSVSKRLEPWLSPLVGAATGVLTGATGVFVIPAAPYFQALGLPREPLVQALGLSFAVSTLALAVGLASRGAFHIHAVVASLLCAAPALVGVVAGQWIRARIDPQTFRIVFFLGLVLLGADLIARSVS